MKKLKLIACYAVFACAGRATNNKAVHIYSIFIILISNLINNPNYPTY